MKTMMKVFDQDKRMMKAEVLKDQFFSTSLGEGESKARSEKLQKRKIKALAELCKE